MKSCTVLVFLVLAATVFMGTDAENPIVKECRKKTGATKTDTGKTYTRAGYCLLACMLKRVKFMNADNTQNIEIEKKEMERLKKHNLEQYNKLVKVLDKCKAAEKPETDECVAAQKFKECKDSNSR